MGGSRVGGWVVWDLPTPQWCSVVKKSPGWGSLALYVAHIIILSLCCPPAT